MSEFESCTTCGRPREGLDCPRCNSKSGSLSSADERSHSRATLAGIAIRPRETKPPFDPASLIDANAYRSPRPHHNAVLIICVVYIGVSIYSISASLNRMRLVQDVLAGRSVGSIAEVTAADDAVGLSAMLFLIAYVTLAAVFIAWFRRMYRNVPALGFVDLEYRPGWAVGAWFVPFLNLFRPKQIADDIWRGSDPERVPEPGTRWRQADSYPLITFWWAGVIIGGIVGRFLLRVDLNDLEDYVMFDRLDVIATIVDLAVVPLAIAFVHLATKRQEARAALWLPVAPELIAETSPPSTGFEA